MTVKDLSAIALCLPLTGEHLRRKRATALTLFLMGVAFAICCTSASGHPPDDARKVVRQRVDLIGPIGTNLPPAYRRAYNRPKYWGGKIAHLIAPSSQEAMAWHRAVHAGAYKGVKKTQRLEQHYWYPKPWQGLKIGPRRSVKPEQETAATDNDQMMDELEAERAADENSATPKELIDPAAETLETLELPESEAVEPELTAPEGVGAAFNPVHVAPASWLHD